MNRNRNYESGAFKRKRKALNLEIKKNQEGSLLRYAINTKSNDEKMRDNEVENVEERTDKSLPESDSNLNINSVTLDAIKLNVEKVTNNAAMITEQRTEETICKNDSRHDENDRSDFIDTEKCKNFSDDPALWREITDSLREYILLNPPSQNMEFIEKSERMIGGKKRYFTANHLYRIKHNQEKVQREWLILSSSTGAVFCWICKLFSKTQSALSSNIGFCDWKHTTERLREHETSHSHREAVCCMIQRKQLSSRIDSKIAENNLCESKYWFEVLRRVVAVTKFLSSRGLPFLGENETIGSVQNGNFLGCLELISEFDPFLAEHLKARGNPGCGRTSYLSSTTINEFISLMGEKVSNFIISEIKSAKYFSIIVDSTPDLSHTDQLTFVVRYVTNECEPVERFLEFIPIHSHTSQHLENTVISFLNKIGLNILDCRGQSFDNASNMAGKYSGLQARIKILNPLAEFIPCAAHSLNLVIVKSVESNGNILDFFTFLQELYNFFSSSTHRWMLLSEKIKENKKKEKLTLKSRSATRWCANAAATRALRQNYKEITDVLLKIIENVEETPPSRNEAKALHKKLMKLETALFTVTWDYVLYRVNSVSKSLQSPSLNISQVPVFYSSLISFVDHVRENFETYEHEAFLLVGHSEYCSKRKRKIPKYLHDGESEEVKLNEREHFKVECFYVMCDSMNVQLKHRMSAYTSIIKTFSCLFDDNKQTAHENAKLLQTVYSTDLDQDFVEEFVHTFPIIHNERSITEKLKKITNLGINGTFDNVEIALKLFLTLPISNCTGERSFSLLKRLKSSSRTTISNSKLTSLSILAIESDITLNLDFNDVIQDFVAKKVRRQIIKNY